MNEAAFAGLFKCLVPNAQSPRPKTEDLKHFYYLETMFNLFKSSSSGVKVIDKVWMSKQAKMNACAEMSRLNPDCLFITWFDETFNELQDLVKSNDNKVRVQSARQTTISSIENRMIVFAEHYPLVQVEQALFKALNLREVPVLSSLDEPFFEKFTGERTIDIMKKLGMNENDVIGHSMITRSMRNAQESIAKRVRSDQQASSQKEWFNVNLPGDLKG
jgi:hypothetical protein